MHDKPFSYIGSKLNVLEYILRNIPKHVCYVEVFCGSAAVFFNKPKSKVEVINDLNTDIYTFFKVLREDYDNLIQMLENTPYSRKMFYELRDYKPKNDLERAWRFYSLVYMSYGNIYRKKPSFGRGITTNEATKFKNKVSSLYNFRDRLRDAIIENLDFRECILKYDSPNTFFYCDPPYLKSRECDYLFPMSEAEHKEFIDLAKNIKGKCMISHYEHPLYDSLGWHKLKFNVYRNLSHKDTSVYTECLYINYEAQKYLY